MPHYKAYDSFKTKKSIEKKQRAKERAFSMSDVLGEKDYEKILDEVAPD